MAYNYSSATDFNRDLVLEIVEDVQDYKTEFRYKGFRDMNEALGFVLWWEDKWEFGYSGHAVAITDTAGNAVVLASRRNSCD